MKIFRFGQDRIDDTLKRLAGLEQDEFDEEVFDFIYEKYNLNEPLNQVQKQIMATHILDMEVYNGGFDQFYLNNKLAFIDDAIDGLEAFGAPEYAEIAKESKRVYLRDIGNFDDKRNPAFDELDEQYYQLNTLGAKRAEFVRQHLNKIITDK